MVFQRAGNGRCLGCNLLDYVLGMKIIDYDQVLKSSETGCDLCSFFRTVAEALWMSLVQKGIPVEFMVYDFYGMVIVSFYNHFSIENLTDCASYQLMTTRGTL